MEVVVKNLKQTIRLAKKFAKSIKGGEKILLNGDLGAGKTTFTKYFAKALGVKDEVTSPSFTILKQYESKKFKINHFDLYRIESEDELIEIGFYEYLNSGSDEILIIEWAERANFNKDDFIKIDIRKIDENKRIFNILKWEF